MTEKKRIKLKGAVRNYQYPFNEHVIILLNELWPAENKTAHKLHRRFSHTG